MNQDALDLYQLAVHELFIRWDGLKLAVEHMGGRHGQQTANEIKTYIFNYCTQNDNIQQSEMVDILNEIMDEEFDTVCEDNSTNELSEKLVIYLKLCIEGKFDEVRHHLSQLPKCVNWLDSSFKIVPAPRGDDDSDSMSDDEDSEEDEDMEMDDNDEAPNLVDPIKNNNRRNRPETDEDGWTTIPTRRR